MAVSFVFIVSVLLLGISFYEECVLIYPLCFMVSCRCDSGLSALSFLVGCLVATRHSYVEVPLLCRGAALVARTDVILGTRVGTRKRPFLPVVGSSHSKMRNACQKGTPELF